jgi:hypothetical protein
MKAPRFDNEEDRIEFNKWLYDIQGIVCDIQIGVFNPTLVKDKPDFVKQKVRELWYEVYKLDGDIIESEK